MNDTKPLTATALAVHQHLNCDLYIHNVYHKASTKSGPDATSTNPSNLADAQFKHGLDWEESLYSWLDDSGLLLKVPSMPFAADSLLENILADDREHFFITGLLFWPPQAKLTERFLQAGTEPLKFGLAKPDLVEIKRINQVIQWRVIDAKVSKNMKTSHHIQIYFYTLCLSYLLPLPLFQSAETSGIWLPPKEGFQTTSPSMADIRSISVSLLAPALDALLFRELPRIISLPVEKVRWHYNPLCQGCNYEPTCRKRAEDEGQLGRIPNISIDDAQALRDILRISRLSNTTAQQERLSDIEELHTLFTNSRKLDQVTAVSPIAMKKGRRILALPKQSFGSSGMVESPVVEAVRMQQVQVISRRNYTCPNTEDIAVVISVVNDPASSNPGGDFFCVSLHSQKPAIVLPASFTCPADEFTSKLAALIRSITSLQGHEVSGRTTQFYVWTVSEQALLQAHVIHAALNNTSSDEDIRLCIGALAQGASLLKTTYQPILLSGALISFLGKGKRLKSEYQACLARLGLSTDGTADILKKRLEEGIRNIREGIAYAQRHHDERRREFGQLPRVVPLMKEVQRQLALPVPGYWNLPECVKVLVPQDGECPSEEYIFSIFKNGQDIEALSTALHRRNFLVYSVLQDFRRRLVSNGHQSILINEAKILSINFMDLCKQEHIRKLFFMQQFEVLAKLTELWKARMDGCPEAPILEYTDVTQGVNGPEYIFQLVSGTVDVPASDRDWAFYDKCLVLDNPEQGQGLDSQTIPVEALFDDLLISGLVFPLNRWTKSSWGQQHPRVQRELVVADVRNVYTDPKRPVTMVALRIWGNWQTTLTPGSTFRLSPRFVDFNTSKVLSALFEIDLLWESEGDLYADEDDNGHHDVPYLQLIMNPNSFGKIHGARKYVKTEGEIQKLFRDLKGLGNNIAGSLVLKSSQHRATQRILSNRLSVIWGPPGTGKTYTVSLSLLRLLEVERRHNGPRRKVVFITAITHAAIEACRSKLVRLIDAYRSIDSLPHKWLDEVIIEVVNRGNDHPGPPRSDNGTYIYAGTLFQLSNFTKRNGFQVDCLVVDEAGQISLGAMALVLRSLALEGRIIVAGDSEQLAPILSAQYPQLKFSLLFGSVLDCLMFSSNDSQPENSQVASQETEPDIPPSQNTVVQLTENFRLNPDLGEFVSTIYSRRFKPQKVQARQLATALKSLSDNNDRYSGTQHRILKRIQTFFVGLSDVMLKQPQTVLAPPEVQSTTQARLPISAEIPLAHRPVSLALIRLRTWSHQMQHVGYESHVRAEAAVAAALVTLLQKCSPSEDIFVATPHRIQREEVKSALRRIEMEDEIHQLEAEFGRMALQPAYFSSSKVTVDTIERLQGSEAAFVICLFSLPRGYTTDLKFMLERRRLNVAISRAKTLCILISSDEVLCPSIKILADEDTAKGYAFLKAFEKRAWSYNLVVNTDDIAQDILNA